ncbi:MAG: lipoprotein [Gammaproteobacteria bacterium]
MSRKTAVMRVCAYVFAASLLFGCGQKGDLYLPDEPQSTPSERAVGDDDEGTEPGAP